MFSKYSKVIRKFSGILHYATQPLCNILSLLGEIYIAEPMHHRRDGEEERIRRNENNFLRPRIRRKIRIFYILDDFVIERLGGHIHERKISCPLARQDVFSSNLIDFLFYIREKLPTRDIAVHLIVRV